eukprot:9492370-Pyramimonas_sp.AAC.1
MRARYTQVLIGQLADIRSYLLTNCNRLELAKDGTGHGPLTAAFDVFEKVPKFFAAFGDDVCSMDYSHSELATWTAAWSGVVIKSAQLDRA